MEGMSATAFEEIVARRGGMDAAQMRMPMASLRTRMAPPKRYRLEDFMTPREGVRGTGEDWVGAMRAEWDDRG